MEKIQCICVMRDLMQALAGIENNLMEVHGVSLNEAMVLCSIGTDTVTAGTIIACTGMTSSHTSKTIRSAEEKGLLTRSLGENDKRQMYFSLTPEGERCLTQLHCCDIEVPAVLKQLL